MRRLVMVAAAAGALTAGCSTEGVEQPPPPARPADRRPTAQAPPPSAADYVAHAGSIHLFVTRASQAALARAQDAGLRSLARELLQSHTGMAAQLSLAGRRLNLLPSAVLRQDHARMLQQLTAAAQFDRLYLRQMIVAHEQALDLHARYGARGSSATLRPVAAAAVPLERGHLVRLRELVR